MKSSPSRKLRGSVFSSVEETTDVEEALRHTLSKQSAKIMHLFRKWDTDGDNTVSKHEFRQAITELGLTASRSQMDALFDSLDADGSGSIDFKELNKGLRRKQSRAARADTNTAADMPDSPVVQNANKVNESESQQQKLLRKALISNSVLVMDLLNEWHENKTGLISLPEFHRALPLVGIDISKGNAEQLFASFDKDNTGTIMLSELQSMLLAEARAMRPSKAAEQVGPQSEKSTHFKAGKKALRDPRGMRVDAALTKAFTASAHKDAEDSEDEDAPFQGGAVITRLKKALAVIGTRVIDVFKQWDENSDGVISCAPTLCACPILPQPSVTQVHVSLACVCARAIVPAKHPHLAL